MRYQKKKKNLLTELTASRIIWLTCLELDGIKPGKQFLAILNYTFFN